MKIVFHQEYIDYAGYASDPAADRGRIKPIIKEIREKTEYEIITPEPATEEDILRAHTERHVRRIKHNSNLYYIASLAAGGAIKTAEIAYNNRDCRIYPAPISDNNNARSFPGRNSGILLLPSFYTSYLPPPRYGQNQHI